jgi:hypothetical protein
VQETYDCQVGAILPHSDEMMALASTGIFALKYPDHEITNQLEKVIAKIEL